MTVLKPQIKLEDLKRLLECALQEFYEEEPSLFNYVSGAVAERCMVFRIGHYMQNIMNNYSEQLFEGLILDCEYNRHGENVKTVDGPKKGIPDLLIHQRKNDDNNILCIEFKKGKPLQNDELEDIKKLEIFTSRSREYKYLYGFHIHLGNSGAEVGVYIDGEKKDAFRISSNKH